MAQPKVQYARKFCIKQPANAKQLTKGINNSKNLNKVVEHSHYKVYLWEWPKSKEIAKMDVNIASCTAHDTSLHNKWNRVIGWNTNSTTATTVKLFL